MTHYNKIILVQRTESVQCLPSVESYRYRQFIKLKQQYYINTVFKIKMHFIRQKVFTSHSNCTSTQTLPFKLYLFSLLFTLTSTHSSGGSNVEFKDNANCVKQCMTLETDGLDRTMHRGQLRKTRWDDVKDIRSSGLLKRTPRLGTYGKRKAKVQPANTSIPGKWPLKFCVCIHSWFPFNWPTFLCLIWISLGP